MKNRIKKIDKNGAKKIMGKRKVKKKVLLLTVLSDTPCASLNSLESNRNDKSALKRTCL